MRARYITTDLELRARFDLCPLLQELANLAIGSLPPEQIYGVWRVTLNTRLPHNHPRFEIEKMLTAIEKLPPTGRAQWDACIARRFNIGYGYADEEFNWSHSAWQFQPSLLSRIAAVNASLVTTTYRLDLPLIRKPYNED